MPIKFNAGLYWSSVTPTLHKVQTKIYQFIPKTAHSTKRAYDVKLKSPKYLQAVWKMFWYTIKCFDILLNEIHRQIIGPSSETCSVQKLCNNRLVCVINKYQCQWGTQNHIGNICNSNEEYNFPLLPSNRIESW